jgi:hypothetical protein
MPHSLSRSSGRAPCGGASQPSPRASAADRNAACRGQKPEETLHIGAGNGDAAPGRRIVGPREVQEDRTAKSRDHGAGVVPDHDDQIVEVIVPPERLRRARIGSPDGGVVGRIPRLIAPSVVWGEWYDWHYRARRVHSIRAVIDPPDWESARWRRSVTFALIGCGLDPVQAQRASRLAARPGDPAFPRNDELQSVSPCAARSRTTG